MSHEIQKSGDHWSPCEHDRVSQCWEMALPQSLRECPVGENNPRICYLSNYPPAVLFFSEVWEKKMKRLRDYGIKNPQLCGLRRARALGPWENSSSSSTTPETPPSVLDSWSDSSSSSPEAMMPYQQSWAVEPGMNCTLLPSQSPIEPPSDGLPRLNTPMGGRFAEWSGPLMASSYSSSRQLKPETRRLPAGKHLSDWVHTKSPEEAPSSLYKALPPVPALPPHSESSSASTNPMTTSIQYHSLPLSLMGPPIKLKIDHEVAPPANPDEAEDTTADPPYSQLIYEALLAAPGKKLPLQGIYLWFEKNTAKGKDRGSKGWQNSIRHNLSMNAGFEAVREESAQGKKPVNYWRLTDEAVNNGIQSTTRYRKHTNYKKSAASDLPAPQRQRSGAKGGKATKITARFRSMGYSINSMRQGEYGRERACHSQQQQQQQQHNNSQHQFQTQRTLSSQRQLPKNLIYSQYLHRSSPTTATAAGTTVLSPVYAGGTAPPTTIPMTRPPAVHGFNLSNIVGCATAPPCTATTQAIFCDMAGPGSDCLVFDTEFMGMDHIHSSFGSSEISTSDLHIGS
ncbi:hypothetical protein BJX76DRAFT_350698 [Aspergillus varians]